MDSRRAPAAAPDREGRPGLVLGLLGLVGGLAVVAAILEPVLLGSTRIVGDEAARNLERLATALEDQRDRSGTYQLGPHGCRDGLRAPFTERDGRIGGGLEVEIRGSGYAYEITLRDPDRDGSCESFELVATCVEDRCEGHRLSLDADGERTGRWD